MRGRSLIMLSCVSVSRRGAIDFGASANATAPDRAPVLSLGRSAVPNLRD